MEAEVGVVAGLVEVAKKTWASCVAGVVEVAKEALFAVVAWVEVVWRLGLAL